jgi:8-oxo-dGTP pyrophosphatase MutT (NUDIX family)
VAVFSGSISSELFNRNAKPFAEPNFQHITGKQAAAGAVIQEADGRVWIVSPTNAFGGYKNTFPKGRVGTGEEASLQYTAIKEVFEETGLLVVLTGFLVDVERSTTVTRYYWARRYAGTPAEMGWESQAVHLIPPQHLPAWLKHKYDQPILQAINGRK